MLRGSLRYCQIPWTALGGCVASKSLLRGLIPPLREVGCGGVIARCVCLARVLRLRVTILWLVLVCGVFVCAWVCGCHLMARSRCRLRACSCCGCSFSCISISDERVHPGEQVL